MADKETIIGPATRVAGELRGEEDVVVRGRVEGRVVLSSLFTVEDGAIVQADVQARIVLISGVVVGNVTATETVRLADKARMVGDITAPRVVMEDGARYKGRLDMGGAMEAADAQTRAAAHSEDEESSDASDTSSRMNVPSRVAAVAAVMSTRSTTAPPSLPRPEDAAAGGVASAPAWAKKKLHRRG